MNAIRWINLYLSISFGDFFFLFYFSSNTYNFSYKSSNFTMFFCLHFSWEFRTQAKQWLHESTNSITQERRIHSEISDAITNVLQLHLLFSSTNTWTYCNLQRERERVLFWNPEEISFQQKKNYFVKKEMEVQCWQRQK